MSPSEDVKFSNVRGLYLRKYGIPIFIDIYSVKEDIKEYFMCKYSVFYGEYEKKKGQKKLTFPDGI